jgi:hypothetical protein
MEVFLLYWDNLDDLVGAAALKSEAARKYLMRGLFSLIFLLAFGGAVLMAWNEPLFGLASATLLFVLLFYHRVTSPAHPALGADLSG